MNIAIIPARSGSKRILNKNTKKFLGKPIIQYSIDAAIQSKVFDRVIVSTDSEEISEIALSSGAEVPFIRPQSLSDDHTPTAPVIEHALRFLISQGEVPEKACCIYATAPLISTEKIVEGFKIINKYNSSSCFTVTSYSFPILRSLSIDESGFLKMNWPENKLTRSQDLPEAYHDAGQFYWLQVDKFLENPSLYYEDSRGVILQRNHVQDIDTMEDWEVAEQIYKNINS